MRTTAALYLCMIPLSLTIGGCSTPASEQVAAAAAVPLTNTSWRLLQLGERVVDNPAGPAAVNLQLDAQNPRVTGFAGCNRMFGGYSLNGDELKFDDLGATKMACAEGSRMKLEQDYFDMLANVASWKISGSSLQLLDSGGASLAMFAADAPTP
jgi:heat shock protein HslJ